MRNIRIVTILFALLTFAIRAQNKKLDSLKAVVNSQVADTSKGLALCEIGKLYLKENDTTSYFSIRAQLQRSLEKTKYARIGSTFYFLEANLEQNSRGNNAKALENLLRSNEYAEKIKDKRSIGIRLNRIAKLYMALGNYKDVPDVLYRSIKVNEEAGNLIGVSYAYFGLGELFRLQKNSQKALEAYYNGYAMATKTQDKAGLFASYTNLGVIYHTLKQYDSALYYYNRSLDFCKENNNELGLASTLDRISTTYLDKKENEKAIRILEQSLSIKLKYDDQKEIAVTYINLTEANYQLKRFKEASGHLDNAIIYSNKADIIELLEYCYKLQGVIYKDLGQNEKSAVSFMKYINLHDSLINIQTSRLASEYEGKFQNEKKQREIEILNKDKALQLSDLKKQKQFIYFIVLVALLLIITVFFIFRSLQKNKKANKIITEQKKLVDEKNHIIEEKQKEIIDSINYGKRIQQSLLANEAMLNSYLPEHFVLFKPKDIVSGDFYWATIEDNKFYLAVCDSTGHGVPGAFMSLLNIGFISEAINERRISEPNLIFDHVRTRLIESISAEGQKDGFDGILICIDLKTKQLSYAAANNAPIFISDGNLIVGETDKMPVGYGEKKDPFSLFTILCEPNTLLYLFTDGYQDQFGGPKGKKFMSKNLNQLLLKVSVDGMPLQKTTLNTSFEDWKGDLEQIDDVCILGIRI
jgi:serine phosphatase RsbU (regulator of sigma subunit)